MLHATRNGKKKKPRDACALGAFLVQAAGLDAWPDSRYLGLPPGTAGGSALGPSAGGGFVFFSRIPSLPRCPPVVFRNTPPPRRCRRRGWPPRRVSLCVTSP